VDVDGLSVACRRRRGNARTWSSRRAGARTRVRLPIGYAESKAISYGVRSRAGSPSARLSSCSSSRFHDRPYPALNATRRRPARASPRATARPASLRKIRFGSRGRVACAGSGRHRRRGETAVRSANRECGDCRCWSGPFAAGLRRDQFYLTVLVGQLQRRGRAPRQHLTWVGLIAAGTRPAPSSVVASFTLGAPLELIRADPSVQYAGPDAGSGRMLPMDRLINSKGAPNVKLAPTEDGAGLVSAANPSDPHPGAGAGRDHVVELTTRTVR